MRSIDHVYSLRSLSSLQPRYSIERAVASIEALGPVGAASFLGSLRMVSLVSRRLSEIARPSTAVRECLAVLSAEADRRRDMYGVLGPNIARLDEIAREEGIQILGGKGLGVRRLYPDEAIRDFNDIDLFVRTRDDATRLCRRLRVELGYRYQRQELPWFKSDPERHLVYGQFALAAPPARPELLNVDIHFGDYSVRHCGLLGLPATFPEHAPGLHSLPLEANLACIVNNAAGDYFVTAKDTNDLLLSLSRFDLDTFGVLIRQARLDGFLASIVAALRDSSILTDEQEAALRELPPARTHELAPKPDGQNWGVRCLGTALHAFETTRRSGVVRATRIAANAFSYYRKRHRLRVVRGRRIGGLPSRLNRWTCVRLVPVDMAVSLLPAEPIAQAPGRIAESRRVVTGDEGVERVDTDAGTYFRIGDEFFVGTVDYALSVDVIRQAATTAAGTP
ncbi:nucleotidyltransferase family protein [Micromonospora sp. DT228]|uniref:nucleotidyltransferase family protein n=1 Tax=Micromonospora sp. DT228 TaxID=3393443 RepID=UPI003CF1B90E